MLVSASLSATLSETALPGPVSPISPGMLRGLYELAPSLGSMLLLPLLLLALLSGEPEHRVSLPGNPPEPPPPRDLLRLN
ncbi:MAG: hypothetical protein HC893_16565 [Chloroflexaceae bacterium]|nr:hypothetical protein [Chloroflexaceae bacterium]